MQNYLFSNDIMIFIMRIYFKVTVMRYAFVCKYLISFDLQQFFDWDMIEQRVVRGREMIDSVMFDRKRLLADAARQIRFQLRFEDFLEVNQAQVAQQVLVLCGRPRTFRAIIF